MAVTKAYVYGLMKDLKLASAKAATHPDADVNTTAKNAIDAIITQLLADGVSPEG